MPITKKDVAYVADLAKLVLSDSDVELYTTQLQRILSYVEKLSAIDTEGIAPTAYTVTTNTPTREDNVSGSLAGPDGLKNAPEDERGYFKVPKIIE
jgi:aspartyl-tRNA(Asn)/glutamyl-tRNA(Gln) amidotransferase subunit C